MRWSLIPSSAGAATLAWLVVHEPTWFSFSGIDTASGIVVLATGVVLAALFLRFPAFAACAVAALVYLNLSEVLVRNYGVPSILQLSFAPLAIAGWVTASRQRLPPARLTMALAFVVALALLSTTVARDRELADARVAEQLKGLAIFLVLGMLAQSRPAVHGVAWSIVGSAATLAALAVFQVATGHFDWDFGGFARIKLAQIYGATFEPRITGPLGDPNFFAQALLMAVPLAFALAAGAGRARHRVTALAAAALVVTAVVLTYSRGGALALAVVLPLSLLVWGIRPRTLVAVGAALLVVAWLAVPQDFARRLSTLNQLLPGNEEVLRPDSSFEERLLFTRVAWSIFSDHPWLGVGAGNYGTYFEDYANEIGSDARLYVTPGEGYYPHNLYLELGAETGLGGLLAFGVAIAFCFAALLAARRHLDAAGDRASAALAIACAVAILGYLLTSIFLHGHFIHYFWLFLGLSGALRNLAARATAPCADVQARAVRPVGCDLDPQAAAVTSVVAIRTPVAVLLSRFPLVTETFILREVIEMERQGQPVVLVPLIREAPDVIHEEARPWIARALYVPFLSPGVVMANLRAFWRQPGAVARAFGAVAGGSLLSPHTLVRSLTLFPKAVALAERLDRAGVRHLHAHYATHPATVALIVSRLTGISFSFTAHAHDIFVRRTLLHTKMREAAFVRAISRFNRNFLLDKYPDVAPERITVIHVGVDPARYGTAAAERAAAWPHPGTTPVRIVVVAALRPYKGLFVLLDACARLARRGVAFTCQIIGEGRERQALVTRIAALGLDGIVSLSGARRQDEVAASLAGASIVVLPSVVARDGQMEGIPVVLMEALASGVPVVATSLSGIPELVCDGETGLLVPPGNPEALAAAVDELIHSRARAEAMGRRGPETIRRGFRLDRCTADLIDRIDLAAPPPTRSDDLPLADVIPETHSGPIGLREILDRRDSRVAKLLVPNGAVPHELVVKIHRSRSGESRPPSERASREFAALRRLDEAAGRACRAPRPRALDVSSACVVMDACDGAPLDGLIRRARFTRDSADRAALRDALGRTGRWLRDFQRETAGAAGDPARALDALAARTIAGLDANQGLVPAYSSRLVRTQLDALRARLAPASLRVTLTHGDFSPGNVFVSDAGVEVIDFEGCDTGLPYEDVANFLIQLELFFPSPALRHRAIELAAAFLDGYLGRPGAMASFDWTAYEVCRIASAVHLLSADRAAGHGRLRGLWRRRALRAMVAGGVM